MGESCLKFELFSCDLIELLFYHLDCIASIVGELVWLWSSSGMVVEEQLVHLLLCVPKIPHGVHWDLTWATLFSIRRRIACDTGPLLLYFTYCATKTVQLCIF
jgi:hypothetical protein